MRWNDRATKGETARIRRGKKADSTPSRQTANRPPPSTSGRSEERGRERPEASKHRGTRQAARNQDEERKHAAVAPQPPHAPPIVSQDGARRRNRTDRRDDKRGERRDEPTGKQDIATRPTRREENITTPHRSRADKASRPRGHHRGNATNRRLSTSIPTAG